MEEIEAAAKRAAGLSRQLLTFSRGGAPIKQAASIAEIIETTARFAMHGSKVRSVFALAPDLATAEVDPGQMDQVVHNLVLNALQAMPDGGTVHLEARNTTLGAASRVPLQPGRYVEFTVRDTGTGIAPAHLRKIFDPFFTTKPGGSGLGLASVYSIVKRHDGHVTVESTPGAGTIFRVYLPASEQPTPASTPRPAAPAASARGRVLVVDDEEALRRTAQRVLSRLGYEVESASDGADALRRYDEALRSGRRFDVVVMDLTIPGGMGGKEAIERLRELDPDVRAVVSSGYSSDPVMSAFRQHGFRAVVEKPYTGEELGAAVRAAIGDGLSAA